METRLVVGTVDGLFDLGLEERRAFGGRKVTALVAEREAWWAILDGREILRSDEGSSWKAAARSTQLKATCLLPTPQGVLVGTADAHLLRMKNGTLTPVESFDQVEGRDEWFTPWGGPPDTRSLSAGPSGILFANVHVGGVVRSTDRGGTWHPTMDIEADCHHVVAHPEDASLVLAATAIGLGVSTDSGKTWRFERAGLHATYQRAVAVTGDRVLVSSARSERGQQAAVYRCTLGPQIRLMKCEQGLPKWFSDNIDTGCLVARGGTAALGTPDGMAFGSEDLGESWRPLREGLPRITCVAFA